MKIALFPALLLVSMLAISGCSSFPDTPEVVYGCYFGEAMKEQCERTPVEEGEQLSCVDITMDTHFELTRCDHHIAKKRYRFFSG